MVLGRHAQVWLTIAALLGTLVVPLISADPVEAGPEPGVAWCTDVGVDTDQGQLLEMGCPGGSVQPGTFSRGCTLDFVMTDGQETYIGVAGHCGPEGKRWWAPGVGWFGTTIFREQAYQGLWSIRDWALIQVDEEDEAHIEPTMRRWGGPVVPGQDLDTRAPVPGEIVHQYGHGTGLGREDATKGRTWQVHATLATSFLYTGQAGFGDSGSPVRYATGQAAGIAVAVIVAIESADRRGLPGEICAQVETLTGEPVGCLALDALCPGLDGACTAPLHPRALYGAVVVTRMDAALAAFEEHLDRELSIVPGELPGLGPPA